MRKGVRQLDLSQKKREVVFNYKVTGFMQGYTGSYKGKYYDSHILKLEVQYMFADFVMHSLVSYFELGYVGSAHGAVRFLGLVFVDGCESLDTSYTERVFAVCY